MNAAELERLIRSTRLVKDVEILTACPTDGSRCGRCGISAATLGIALDADAVCTECRRYERNREGIERYFRTGDDLRRLFDVNQSDKRSDYDCLLLYSGGKDSTYVLYQLINMGLKVLTFTFDNGFISRQALDNIRSITAELGIEAIIAGHAEMKEVFRESLSRFSTVCKGCFKALLDLSLQLADERGINVIVTGLSRGQIVEERLKFFYENGQLDRPDLEESLEKGRQVYHLMERFSGLEGRQFADGTVFDRVRLIDYFRYSGVTKAEIYEVLRTRNHRWTQPTDTGFCSSNCLINDVGVSVHLAERGYSNYEVPTSWEVRLGHLDRGEALKELSGIDNPERVQSILRSLAFQPKARGREGGVVARCTLAEGATIAGLERALAKALPAGDPLPNLLQVESEAADPDGEALADSPVDWDIPPSARFEGPGAERSWQVRTLDRTQSWSREEAARALLNVWLHHPALRLRPVERGALKRLASPGAAPLPFTYLDLSGQPAEQRRPLIGKATQHLLAKALQSPPGAGLVRFLVAAPNELGGTTLIVASHDLVIDESAWPILVRDIDVAARPSSGAAPMRLSEPAVWPAAEHRAEGARANWGAAE